MSKKKKNHIARKMKCKTKNTREKTTIFFPLNSEKKLTIISSCSMFFLDSTIVLIASLLKCKWHKMCNGPAQNRKASEYCWAIKMANRVRAFEERTQKKQLTREN